MNPARCFKVNNADNVATMLDDADAGAAVSVLGEAPITITSLDPINLGHKIAIRDIASGQPVIKFGVPIGHATCDIRVGQWIHLHNCASNFDQRSQTLDVRSGAVTDTKYE
jgi:hypothetical protein